MPEIGSTPAPNQAPAEQQGVSVVENLGAQLPLDLPFIDSKGDMVRFGDTLADGGPTILALVYFDCPVVCNVVMGELTQAFKGMDFTIGEEFNVVFASIDPSEQPPLAASVKDRYLTVYGRAGGGSTAEGWSFLTSPSDSTRVLAEKLGWTYKPVAGGEYSHPVCVFILTPEGAVARYIYGVGYDPDTFRMALLEASEGRVSESIGDMIRMFCFRYDPTTGKYSLVVYRVVQLGGIVSVLSVGGLIAVMLIKERVRRARAEGRDRQERLPHAQQVAGSTT